MRRHDEGDDETDFNEVMKQEDYCCAICTLPALYKLFSGNHLQQSLQQTRPSAIRRPGRIYTFLPKAGPFCNIQIAGTEILGVGI